MKKLLAFLLLFSLFFSIAPSVEASAVDYEFSGYISDLTLEGDAQRLTEILNGISFTGSFLWDFDSFNQIGDQDYYSENINLFAEFEGFTIGKEDGWISTYDIEPDQEQDLFIYQGWPETSLTEQIGLRIEDFGLDLNFSSNSKLPNSINPDAFESGNVFVQGYSWKQEQDRGYMNLRGTITKFAAVPEPSTTLLLGAGLIGLARLGRKKFTKK